MNKIKYNFCVEQITSRTPALFAYIEFNENGECVLHHSYDSVDGCYGKLIPNIRVPKDCVLFIDGVCIIDGGCSYSYQYLLKTYNEYNTVDSPFTQFMCKCIGKQIITADIDKTKCDLVPEYIYTIESIDMYNTYIGYKAYIERYKTYIDAGGQIDCNAECLINKYERMGGDTMLDYYKNLMGSAVAISNSLYDMVDLESSTLDFSFSVSSTTKDLGVMSQYFNYWVGGEKYYYGDMVTYDNKTWVCTCKGNQYTIGIYNELYDEYEFDYDNFKLSSEYLSGGLAYNSNNLYGEHYDVDRFMHLIDEDGIITIHGTSDSKLSTFKGGINYISYNGLSETPEKNEDWLCLYEIGVISRREISNDRLNNIILQDDLERTYIDNDTYSYISNNVTHIVKKGDIVENLMAYGDVLTNISYIEDEKVISFDYVIGCNLRAVFDGCEIDSDGDIHYYYKDFGYNSNDIHGVKFCDLYYYGSEIQEIIDNNFFNDYINGKRYQQIGDTIKNYQYYKCSFNTVVKKVNNSAIINGSVVNYGYIMSDFECRTSTELDSIYSPLIKTDYLTGICYSPIVKSDVNINRGNAHAWERHIKLGEIKTFEDLVNYSNGGFFNLM